MFSSSSRPGYAGNGEMMDWFYDVCDEMADWMAHSREAVYDVDLDAPQPTLDTTGNFTTVCGDTWYAMPDKDNAVFIHDVGRPQSVKLLRTGAAIERVYRVGSLRIAVPKSMRTKLPDMIKMSFKE
ncbi:hypothetical protein [Aporhodopirellula aestuarii]|uniref:Uncharacterized protein n=1 Tax=Aporhodopirellula aestuarii TaxID=2950107 RepID=A0ABT0UCR1_9BACT|nr:hypothetical protein [Aporhodopirellula aestuarii]MCM2374555.1 hypothetical protein [Aporhodopirellula aestuarii]